MTDLSNLETEMFAAAFRFQKALADKLTNENNELNQQLKQKEEIIISHQDATFILEKKFSEVKAQLAQLLEEKNHYNKTIADLKNQLKLKKELSQKMEIELNSLQFLDNWRKHNDRLREPQST